MLKLQLAPSNAQPLNRHDAAVGFHRRQMTYFLNNRLHSVMLADPRWDRPAKSSSGGLFSIF